MCNAADLAAGLVLDPDLLSEGRAAAEAAGLRKAAAAFFLSQGAFERKYFALFDELVAELRGS